MKNISEFPKYIMIQTTSRCNASCLFCPYPHLKNSFDHNKMDFSLFKKIVDECGNYSHIERIMPYLMNEPLIDTQLEDKIDYAKEKNPNAWIHFLSNGSLLTHERSLRLINSTLNQICFSVHSIDKKIYEQTMGLNFENTMYNITNFIKLAKEHNKPQNYIMITFFKWQQLDDTEKDKALHFWQEQGISEISVFNGPISRAGNVPTISSPLKQTVSGCNSIWADDMIHILANGDVVPCCMDWKKEHILGNVKKEALFDIWHSKAYDTFRKQLNGTIPTPENFLCKRCESSA